MSNPKTLPSPTMPESHDGWIRKSELDVSIKGAGGKSGGCAWKAIKLTSGDLPLVVQTRLTQAREARGKAARYARGDVAFAAALLCNDA